MSNTLIALVSIDSEQAIGDEKDATEMLKKSFAAARNHFMVLDEDLQMKGGLNAVLKKMGDEHPDKDRLTTEIQLLGQMNAFFNASRAGLEVSMPEIPEGYEAIGVVKLWHESKEARL